MQIASSECAWTILTGNKAIPRAAHRNGFKKSLLLRLAELYLYGYGLERRERRGGENTMLALVISFFVTAAIYASVGFGGGSTYTALLTLSDVDPKLLPIVSLMCNIIVVTGGAVRFARAGQMDWRRALPLVLISAPLAWLGGLTPISVPLFRLLLGISLLGVAGLMFIGGNDAGLPEDQVARSNSSLELIAAGGLGYLAGLVGIGGGIFLAPLLHLTRWGHARAIAAVASLFILVNSLFGLGGQMTKHGTAGIVVQMSGWWPVMLAVLVGGQLGSLAGVKFLSLTAIRRLTGLLIIYAALQLLWKAIPAFL